MIRVQRLQTLDFSQYIEDKELYRNYIKRLLDIILSSFSLLVLSPLLGITALLVRAKLGSPVIFKQARPGKNEKIFYLYKFRSMTNEIGEDGKLLPDAQRLTRFGKFLRASSLDELLELVNIIKGDMSIVGPRPLSIYYLPHYSSKFRKRHSVRPGLTGLAQANGRNNLPWDERFDMDIEYVERYSFALDFKIIFDTVFKVLKHSDITVRGTNKVKDYGPYRILQEENNAGKQLDGMTYSEIGSYFWLEENITTLKKDKIEWLPSVEDSAFTFSGRNAIDLAIRDILNKRDAQRVYVPSYGCVSMLQSFIDRGLKIEFYDVGYQEGVFTYKLPVVDEHSVILLMSYFGLSTWEAHNQIVKLKKSGAVVIEDISHSLLSKDPMSENSDYLVASLRKWFGIPTGGWVGKRNGTLSVKPNLDGNHVVREKIAAMREKYDYLTGKIESKEDFLFGNATFENDLIHVDRMLKIDDMSQSILVGIDIASVIEQRRKNAMVLMRGLRDLEGKILSLPVTDLDKNTPLFLPIFMATEDRDALRMYLMDNGIYCPIHWLETMGAEAGVRTNELSLICDQRYSEGDMQVIVDMIHTWNRGNHNI